MINTFVKKLVNFGVVAGIPGTEANRIRLINLVAIIPFPLFLFSTIYCIVFNFPRIVYTNLIPLTATLLILYLNQKRKYTYAKLLFLCSNALVLLIYYKLMDNEISMFFYFFPIILCFLLFYDVKQEKTALYFTGIFTAVCILLTLFLPSSFFKPSPLSAELHLFINRFNSVGCVIVVLLYTYHIFKTNAKKEEQLVKAKEAAEAASKAKAVFLSNMSHELRTPLNGIVGTANLLKMDHPSKELDEHFTVMQNLSEHMMALVNDILDYSKMESGKLDLHPNRFNIAELLLKLDGIFKRQFKEKGIEYKTDIDPSLKLFDVYSDDMRLQQIMNNLLSNALKFTHHGQVYVNATVVKRNQHTVTVLFNVVDEGIGIEEHHIQKIFESFSQADSGTTRKYGGTGLGLSISANLVKLFNSELHVNSTPGKGSNFYFQISFPVSEKQTEIVPKPQRASVNQLENKRILIAEDNPVNMSVARRVLQRWGVTIEEAENGNIALNKCREQQFDLLLIDLEMPEMDGKTAVKAINQLSTKAPAIAFTAAVYENMKDDLRHHGFADYILKPFKPDELYQKIADLIGE